MGNSNKSEQEIFTTTICSICRLCKNPDPGFCMTLYNTDISKFTNEIMLRVKYLKEIDIKTFLALRSFEGFTALFCHPKRCPLYEKDCESKLSTHVVCFQAFSKQSRILSQLQELRDLYAKWSGIELNQIGKKFNTIEDISKISLSKKQSKKIRKSIKKARKRLINIDKQKELKEKKMETLLFYNSNKEWEEKISIYLNKNGHSEDHNRQSNKASKCT